MQLYTHRDGQQYGPYSVEQVREFLAAGNLLTTDLGWHEGIASWIPLSQITEIALPETKPALNEQPAWVPPRRGDALSPSESRTVTAAPNAFAASPATKPHPATSSPAVKKGSQRNGSPRRSSAVDGFTKQQRAGGIRNMALGLLWFIGGIAVTVFSYQAASSSPHGGTYFITWGAVVFGIAQFIKGAIQFCRA